MNEPFSEINSVTLERLQFAMNQSVGAQLMEHFGGTHQLTLEKDFMLGDYVIRLRSSFFCKKTHHILPPLPVTWWDHFKRDALPTFSRLLKLKIRERREVLLAATVYPDLPQIQGRRFYYHESMPLSQWKETNEH